MTISKQIAKPDSTGQLLQLACDRAVAFRRGLASRRPRPTISAPELDRLFNEPTPEHGEGGALVIEALADIADRGLMASAGTRFFGWVIGASHPVAVAADWLTSAWGQNAANFAASPAAAMAEKVARRWLLDLLDLPRDSSIGFVTGATMANFTCLAAARNAQFARHGWDVEADGVFRAPPMHIFVGEDAHATVFSALRYLGFGTNRLTRVPADDQGRMKPVALERMMTSVEGPKIVIAQAGQINTGAFDPFLPIAAITRANDAWLHIDGAFGLWARTCPQTRKLSEGIDLADSWATDGHKWLQLPYDCGFAIVRDARAHSRAVGIEASYLPQAQEIEHDPSQYAPELSRRARGFAAWAMLRALGREGIAEMVRRHCDLARRLAGELSGVPEIEILNDVTLNQIILGFGKGMSRARQDCLARATIEELQRENSCFAAGALWRGRWVMRISIISASLQEEDIDRLSAAIRSALRRAQSRNGCGMVNYVTNLEKAL
jgi:glutamate/tyrosine decarboxylase-like PLP-dependent enzyme